MPRTKPASTVSATPARNRGGEHFEVDNVVLSRFVLDILLPAVGVQPFPLAELVLMAGALCWAEPTDIFEWGTHRGASARVFWETSAHFGIGAQITSIDLPDDVGHVEHPGKRRGELIRGKDRIQLRQGDGLEVSLAACRELPEEARILFFLDGDHSFDSVRRELSAIVRDVPGAVVLIHDTFLQSPDSGYNVGPHRAIDRALADAPDRRYERVSTDAGLPGMTLLIPRR